MKLKVAAILLAAIVASGCSTGDTSTEPQTGEVGQLQLYISDQPADIQSFDYLDVTVSEVRVYKASMETGNQTGNMTNSSNSSETGFETFNVSQTVDLTQLQGDNATSVLEADLEAGNYSKMELEASEVNAEVDNSSVDVKLPSGKLQLTKSFQIAPNSTTEFVFDIQVVQRGNQGYVLRPVISQSGTVGQDVEINRKSQSSRPDRNGSGASGSGDSGNPSAGNAPGVPE